MSTTPTTNYGWLMPDPGTEIDTWGPIVNQIFEDIDAEVFLKANIASPTFTGVVTVPAGSAAAPSLSVNGQGGLYSPGAGLVSVAVGGTERGRWGSSGLAIGAGFDPASVLDIRGSGVQRIVVRSDAEANLRLYRYSSDVSTSSAQLVKGRGTQAAPAIPASGDSLGSYQFRGYTSGSVPSEISTAGALIAATALEATWGAAAAGTRLVASVCPVGSGTLAEIMRLDAATGFSMFGANVVIDQNRNLNKRTYTIATLPTATAGISVNCSDLGGGAGPLEADGTGWLRTTDGYQEKNNTTDFTLTPLTDGNIIELTGTLAANRVLTLSTTNIRPGQGFLIARSGSAGFVWNIGGVDFLLAGEWVRLVWSGAAYRVVGKGDL